MRFVAQIAGWNFGTFKAMSQFTVKILGFAPSFRHVAMTSSRFSLTRATNRTFSTAIQSWKPSNCWQPLRTVPLVGRGNLTKSPTICAVKSRVFHTTSRNDIPPVVLLFVKPLAKLVSIISGRTFRKWWQRLSPEQKQYYKDHIFKRKTTIGAVVAILCLASIVHYYTHLQSTPLTNRRRYVALTPEQFLKIAQFECDMELESVKDKIVAPNNAVYKNVLRVVQRIVNSNQDLDLLSKQVWTVTVVDSDEANASVLPTGNIFVNTGLLKVAQNEDQLAVVLGHEIAHALLGHGAEHLSFATVLDVVVIIVMGAIWAIMPTDGIAIVTDWFYNRVMQLMLHLPYSRKLEMEADEVGLQLIAKACYDIRESTVFWSAMAAHNELNDSIEMPQWLSTHPANETRAEKFEQLMPQAIKQRQSCNCPALSVSDPRARIAVMQQMVDEKRRQRRSSKDEGSVALPSVKPTPTPQANT